MQQLQPITVMPVQRPTYRNERIHDFRLWYRDNEPVLEAYWKQLEGYLTQADREAGVPEDYWMFAAVQHERAERELAAPMLLSQQAR